MGTVLEALLESRGFILAVARGKVGGVEAMRPLLTKIERAIASGTERTLYHDSGATARCSRCGRYSNDFRALRDTGLPCDCGETHYWTGSFVQPGDDSEWCIGVNQ
jgi:hypothetical protein